jgi:hypothetical protein
MQIALILAVLVGIVFLVFRQRGDGAGLTITESKEPGTKTKDGTGLAYDQDNNPVVIPDPKVTDPAPPKSSTPAPPPGGTDDRKEIPDAPPPSDNPEFDRKPFTPDSDFRVGETAPDPKRRVVTGSPENYFRTTAGPVQINSSPKAVETRAFFVSRQFGSWQNNERDRAAYALLYGDDELRLAENSGGVIENLQPNYVRPFKIKRFTDRQNQHFLYDAAGNVVVWDNTDQKLYFADSAPTGTSRGADVTFF